jgi:cellobionic acid phosphorylase
MYSLKRFNWNLKYEKKMNSLLKSTENGERLELYSPTLMPNASAFLWNNKMMIHMNCRGYAVAQFMQPEPAKYAHAPNIEAKTFMQPEQPYYAHHPGRFFYVKDEEDGTLFSVPHEPVRSAAESFVFSAGKSDIRWMIKMQGLQIEMCLTLPKDDVVELWSFSIQNTSGRTRKISVYPYFPVGYMSWMNQGGEYREDLQGIVCTSITPYQKYKDYFTIKNHKDKTYFLADKKPTSWEVNQQGFEGEGGLNHPTAIQQEELLKGNACYETPACVFQYRMDLKTDEKQEYRFLFGPAKDNQEISEIREKYFLNADNLGFDRTKKEYSEYIRDGRGCIQIKTPDAVLDQFVNHWLPRQIYYHGSTNRLSTDPQTRNFMQDNMGMSFIQPAVMRDAFCLALSQQHASGEMPDGILLYDEAELKYINQVPHTDHCVWLPVCLKAYLDETNDYALLDETVPFSDGEQASVSEHVNRAMQWLLQSRDERGLNYINQGDWCDPMNMVGYKGKGVSGWLTLGTAYALKVWSEIGLNSGDLEQSEKFRIKAQEVNSVANLHLWDGDWYARGITDDNVIFGISKDKEGRIFLNPQGWALLSGAPSETQREKLTAAVREQLESPYGVEMFGPPYTAMREDVGRVTQKFPGSAENGSVYNHAASFYIYGLYTVGEKEDAYRLLRKMIPGPDQDDLLQRGQLPVFIPNYYRGAYRQIQRTAGRSSQLFNTGTVSWVYRSLIEGLFGVRGDRKGLRIEPQLPGSWKEASIVREFRGAVFNIHMVQSESVDVLEIKVNGEVLEQPVIENFIAGGNYQVEVKIPA